MSVQAEKATPKIWRFLIPLVVLAVVGALFLMFVYEIIYVDFDTGMENQPSIRYQEPPRHMPPEESVPILRPLYLDEPATMENPVPSDIVSLQRGRESFDFHCAVCHGVRGRGDGPVTEYWKPDSRPPADLSAERYKQYPDNLLYRVITQGVGSMPPLRENLTERQYWDIINYVKTLQP